MAKSNLPTITNKQQALRKASSSAGSGQLRKDYSRLRDAAVKRVQRAMAAGYMEKGLQIPTLKEIGKDPAALASEYSRLSKFIESSSGSLTGMREEASKRVETFNKLGYDFVTPQNELQFGKFMGQMIEKYSEETPDGKKMLLDSDIIVEGFDYVREHTKSSNKSTLSRLFNTFLRLNGYNT